MTPVEFYFDVSCPWTWMTSRWITDVAPQRDLDVTWRTYSLKIRNEGREIPPQFAEPMAAQFRALRVIEAARAAHGDDVVGPLYTQIGARIHHDGDRMLDGLADAVGAAGVDLAVMDAADDETWDAVVRASTDTAVQLVGEDVGIPIVRLAGTPTFSGPIVSPAPRGDAAAKLWDAFVALEQFDGVYEIKRSRMSGGQRIKPQFGPRP
jgi:mycothiol-dependent nitroreductase-like protein